MISIVALTSTALAVLLFFPASKYWKAKAELVSSSVLLEQTAQELKSVLNTVKYKDNQVKKWRTLYFENASDDGGIGIIDSLFEEGSDQDTDDSKSLSGVPREEELPETD